MKVHIERNLYIKSDSMNFIISEFNGTSVDEKTGREYENWNNLGYYSTLRGAMKDVISRKIKESTAADLKQLLQDVEKITQWAESIKA